MGGASGGYTAARKRWLKALRQRLLRNLFSSLLAPAIVAASIKVLEMVEAGSELRDRLWANARQFREQMSAAAVTLAGADHAIIPVMLGETVERRRNLPVSCKSSAFTSPVSSIGCSERSGAYSIPRCLRCIPSTLRVAVEAFTRIQKQLGVIA
ncbi:aminotransferase class I/II-fold pyridoxal phosphate-dependent enzyme [Shigella flexneri]